MRPLLQRSTMQRPVAPVPPSVDQHAVDSLIAAADDWNWARVRDEVCAGFPVNATDSSTGGTLLHVACWRRNEPTVALLLERGADANVPGVLGRTPVHLAALEGSAPVLRAVCDAGGDVNRRDTTGASPLALILKPPHHGDCVERLRVLLDCPALDLSPAALVGVRPPRSAAHASAATGGPKAVTRALAHMLDTEVRTRAAWSPPRQAWMGAVARAVDARHHLARLGT